MKPKDYNNIYLQLPVQAINKQVVNTAQYDQQPLADHQASPALTPRMAQNSALIPVMVGFYLRYFPGCYSR